MMVDRITCSSCRERMREFEPDIVLRKIDGSAKYFYHVGCVHDSQRIVATEGGGVWNLTRRHVFWEERTSLPGSSVRPRQAGDSTTRETVPSEGGGGVSYGRMFWQ